jgi:transposase InsO family protein
VLGHDLSAGHRGRHVVPFVLILDLYSRKIVGWEVHATDDSVHAAQLVRRTALAEGIATMLNKPVLHGDNGATLKATTVLGMLYWLGIKPSYSRPRVSDDNAYAESLFRTAKYRPEFPAKGFVDLDAARTWAAEFVRWYNDEHRHSGIRYVTPGQRQTATITPSWPLATRCTSRPVSATQRAGPAQHATGHRPAQSPSIPNATRSSRRTRQKIGSRWLHE